MTNDTQTHHIRQPTVGPVPRGYTKLAPHFCVDGAERAVGFYCAVLGGEVVGRTDNPDGTVAHCDIQLPSGRMQVSDPAPAHHLVPATGADDVSRSTVAYVPDVDAAYGRAISLGAKAYDPPSMFVTGDRYAALLDPRGHRWAIMTRVEDVEPEEAERRLAAWLAEREQ